ncbi:MAG: hypothetical protein ACI96M_003844, partial [Candidatus Azotimanducaceae bacterium]
GRRFANVLIDDLILGIHTVMLIEPCMYIQYFEA